jgi:hypothetical protein
MHDPLPRDVHRRRFRRALAASAGQLLLLVLPVAALAHAELVSSSPAAGAILTEVPAEIVLTFDEAVVGNSSFQVKDASGATVAEGAPDPAAPTTMTAVLPALEPGEYLVQWTSVAEDTDVEHGTFTFTVAEPTPPPPTDTPVPTIEPSASPTSSPSEAPTASPAPSSSSSIDGTGTSGTDVLLPIAAVAILIGAGLTFFLRRRGPA